MTDYLPTIGLEIHAELKTATKMFCRSKNDPSESRPNVNICPVCMAHPGTLPVINKEAIRHVLNVGLALQGRLANYTEFDRKNYFYPDLPKGYQISQYEFPLVSGGTLAGVDITRVHLEEDTARSAHDSATGETVIDYNRAGVPLMELVTEPVIHSAAQAGAFARELQLLLRYLDASEANMEQGQMRVEANVSVGKHGVLGTKVEIKNLNSFRAMERAVEVEIRRQIELLEGGGTVLQETLGWDEARQKTFPQRIKEGSADYRYFPDPDLPSLLIEDVESFREDVLRKSMPELPSDRRIRFESYGVKTEDVEAFTRNAELGNFFESVIADYNTDKKRIVLAANYISNDLVSVLREVNPSEVQDVAVPVSGAHFNRIMDLITSKKVSSRAAKDLLRTMVVEKRDPMEIASERGLLQERDEQQVLKAVEQVLSENPKAVSDLRAGKQAALEYLVGKTMGLLRGAADPEELRSLIQKKVS